MYNCVFAMKCLARDEKIRIISMPYYYGSCSYANDIKSYSSNKALALYCPNFVPFFRNSLR